MTDSEPSKNSAKGFAGLASRVSDISADSASAAKTPNPDPQAPFATGSASSQPARAKQPARGFAGLSSKVSDVSEDVARAADVQQAVPPPSPTDDARPPRAEQNRIQSKPAPAAKSGKAGWAWGVACIAVCAIWVANSGTANHSQPPPASGATPALSPMAPGTALDGAAMAATDERMPPVGRNNVLGIPEIRWCKREKIRIDAIEIVMNPAYDSELSAYNARVDDYNSRCAEFRYRRGQVEQVNQELAAQRESIATASQSQWYQAWARASDGLVASPASAERVDEPQPMAFGSTWGAKSERTPAQTDITQDEQESIDSACGGQKTLYGQAAYDRCVSKKILSLKTSPRHVDLNALSVAERESIESACGGQRTLEGPAAYNTCLISKLAALKAGPRNLDLSALNPSELESIESSCSGQKTLDGPAAYNRCLSMKLASFKAGPRNVDLSGLSDARRESIESACSGQKLLEGPAAYNRCLTQKLGRLKNE